jgi:TP901-1 family phage major tail protein
MATAGVINGSDFFMYHSKTVIAHATSHTLNVNLATRDISSKDSAGWKGTGAGQRSWTASGNGLYTFDAAFGFSQLMALVTNRTRVYVKLATKTATNKAYWGYGYLTSITLDAPNEDNSTYSFSFEGDGALTEITGT